MHAGAAGGNDMRRRMLIALIGLLAVAVTGSAGAATLDFTGTLLMLGFGLAALAAARRRRSLR